MSARDDRAEAMREACAEAVREIIDSIDDKGLFNKTEAACIRSTLRRAVSRIEALPLPATTADDVCAKCRPFPDVWHLCTKNRKPTTADDAVDPDAPIKCGTFGGVTIPPDVRARMDADRAAAEASAPKPHGFPPVYYFADDAQGNPCLFWRNPFSGEPESLARFMWPTHPKEWDVDGWWEKFTLTVVAALNPPPFTLKGGPRE